jgi:iron-sulfur cluster repair protein YtfE (RIC family)
MEESIKTYFEKDHDRLDELFRNFQKLKRVDYSKAKEFFKEFKFGLQRHIVWEEEILFPIFEQKTGMAYSGPTRVMRVEHEQIGKQLEAIHEKVQKRDPDSDEEEHRLLSLLSLHNQKEEYILYPAIDKSLSDAERAAVFAAMKNIPEERYKVCCGNLSNGETGE